MSVSLGTVARRVLGPAFPVVGTAYRRLFVNVDDVARAIPQLPDGGLLLDVGGGDGSMLNPILARQPTIRATLIDVAPTVGAFLKPANNERVTLSPATSVRDYINAGGEPPSLVLLADVFHHVPPADRRGLIRDLFDVFGDTAPLIAVKDVEPHGLRAAAGFWADNHISGEPTWPIGQDDLFALFREANPDVGEDRTCLYAKDRPNYCSLFSLATPSCAEGIVRGDRGIRQGCAVNRDLVDDAVELLE